MVFCDFRQKKVVLEYPRHKCDGFEKFTRFWSACFRGTDERFDEQARELRRRKRAYLYLFGRRIWLEFVCWTIGQAYLQAGRRLDQSVGDMSARPNVHPSSLVEYCDSWVVGYEMSQEYTNFLSFFVSVQWSRLSLFQSFIFVGDISRGMTRPEV